MSETAQFRNFVKVVRKSRNSHIIQNFIEIIILYYLKIRKGLKFVRNKNLFSVSCFWKIILI